MPYGTSFKAPVYCWNDQWPFAAEGIPGMRLGTSNPTYSSLYHTNYETIDLVDYGYLAKIAKFIFRVDWRLERGLLPYDLPARAETLAASVDGDVLLDAGADADTVARLVDDVAAFSAACDAYDAGKGVHRQRRRRQPHAAGDREGHPRRLHRARLLGLHDLPARAGTETTCSS